MLCLQLKKQKDFTRSLCHYVWYIFLTRKIIPRNIPGKCYLEEHLILPDENWQGPQVQLPASSSKTEMEQWRSTVPKALPGKWAATCFPQVMLLVGKLMLLLKPDVPGPEPYWASDDNGYVTLLLFYFQQILPLVSHQIP